MPISIAGSGAVTGASTLNGLTVPTDAIAPALVLVTSQTVSAASSVSVNNVFSSSYQNYRIVINANMTANNNVLFRLRASGTDSTTSYYEQEHLYTGTTTAGSRSSIGTAWNFVRIDNANLWNNAAYDIYGPNLARVTGGTGSQNRNLSSTTISIMNQSLLHDSTVAYDGFTLSVASGTFSGEFRLYGYRN